MGLKRSFTDGLGRLFGTQSDSRIPTPTPQRSSATPDRGAPIDPILAFALVRFWRDFHGRFKDYEGRNEHPHHLDRADELMARIDGMGNDLPDVPTCCELLSLLSQMVVTVYDELNGRIEEMRVGTREYQRRMGAQELTASHLTDEFERCQVLLAQEAERRNLPVPATAKADGHAVSMHDRLTQLFEAMMKQDRSPASGAVLNDPVIHALERLLASPDPATLRTMPDWVKKPAARILELIAERNRYRRLLEHAGMLPIDPAPPLPSSV